MASVKSLTIGGKTIFDLVYPVGSIYETDNEGFDPNTSFGGTWERIKGKVIVGVDKADGAFDAVGKTGGEKNHTLTESELPKISGGFSLHGDAGGTIVYDLAGHFVGDKVSGKYKTISSTTSGAFSHKNINYIFGGGAPTTTCLHTMLHTFGEELLKKLFLLRKRKEENKLWQV